MQETIDGLDEVRSLAAQFATDRLRPNVERWDHERSIDAEVSSELAELGFHGILVPEAFGGLDFGLATLVAVLEEMAWGEPAVAFSLLASAVVATALKQSASGPNGPWLEALAGGSVTGAMRLVPGGGAPEAVPNDGGWTLNGGTRWVIRGSDRNMLLVEAVAGVDRVLFCVPADTAGITVVRREDTLGLRAARIEALTAANVALPSESHLGSVGTGVETVQRLGTAAIATGIARTALEHATGYADVREQFGQKIRRFQGIRVKLADMSVRVAAAGSMLKSAITDGGPVEAARAKVFASESAMWVTTQAVQIYGGYGYMRDYPVEKTMRDAKATELMAGTNDALREVIAGALYED